MPAALQFQNLPADQIKGITDQLYSQWQIEANALRVRPFKSQRQADYELAKLNSKYQQLELTAVTKIQRAAKEQQQKRELISGFRRERQAGEMGAERRAALELELTPSQEQFVFGRVPKPDKPLSVAQIMSPSLTKSIDTFFEDAPTVHKLFVHKKYEKKTKKGLLEAYGQWREIIRYDMLNPVQQRQLDDRLDQRMAADTRYKSWFSDDVQADLKIIRSKGGEIAEVMKDRALGVSPLAKTLRTAKQRRQQFFRRIRETGAEPQARQVERPATQPRQKPIRQRNKVTGQERISYDGGKTWSIL